MKCSQYVINGGCSSVGRAPDCGSGCRRFKSCHPPHEKNLSIREIFLL